MIDIRALKDNHNGGLRQLLKIYNKKGDLYKGKILLFSLGFNLVLTTVSVMLTENLYDLISKFLDFYISALPSLLGFNLGAYALLIGLGSSNIIDKLSASFKTRFTSFQRASSVFGFCVLVQVAALIIAFTFKTIIFIEDGVKSNTPTLFFNPLFSNCINVGGFFLLNLFGIYSILILVSVIENIFAISQASHFFAVTKHLREEKEAKTNNVKFISFVENNTIITSGSELEGTFLEWGSTSITTSNRNTEQTVAIVRVEKKIYQVLPTSITFTQ